MIREFAIEDLQKLEPNALSAPDGTLPAFEGDTWWRYTLENNGVKAIICFLESEPRQWVVFALISKYFNTRDTLEMKRFMRRVFAALRPEKLWTLSEAAEVIGDKHKKWLRFFGFTFGESKEFEGKPYNVWAVNL